MFDNIDYLLIAAFVLLIIITITFDHSYIGEDFNNETLVPTTSVLTGQPTTDSTSVISVQRDTRYDMLQREVEDLRRSQRVIKNDMKELIDKINTLKNQTSRGDYIVNGWFVQFHNVIDSPGGVLLGETINKTYGVPIICFRSREGYPFVGPPDRPLFFPKADNVGLRAMTILKVPKTGYYDFKVLTDDGMRLYYQKVTGDVLLNEKNVRTVWENLVDSWLDQAEVWVTSKKLYFQENDMIFIRVDYYELTGYASACIRLRYYPSGQNGQSEEMDLPYNHIFCSLLWSEVPLLGVF